MINDIYICPPDYATKSAESRVSEFLKSGKLTKVVVDHPKLLRGDNSMISILTGFLETGGTMKAHLQETNQRVYHNHMVGIRRIV